MFVFYMKNIQSIHFRINTLLFVSSWKATMWTDESDKYCFCKRNIRVDFLDFRTIFKQSQSFPPRYLTFSSIRRQKFSGNFITKFCFAGFRVFAESQIIFFTNVWFFLEFSNELKNDCFTSISNIFLMLLSSSFLFLEFCFFAWLVHASKKRTFYCLCANKFYIFASCLS